jgi:large subunit ribosomal protein L9
MEVILKQDVDGTGLRGEVVNVARGYARNFLLPRGLAEAATPALVRELEKRDEQRARHEAKTDDEAKAIATRVEALELRFDVNAGPTGALFGSVTPTNVADRLWDEEKIRVDRRKLGMDAIKRIGRYTVPVELFADVTAELKLVVAPEGVELPPQAELDALAAAETAAAEAAAQAAREADLFEEAPTQTAAERAEAKLIAASDEEAAAESASESADEAEAGDSVPGGDEPAADADASAGDTA